jgi:hypothetical protein
MSLPLRAVGAATLAAASLFTSAPALACSCVFPPVQAAREDAAALFEGRVLDVVDVARDAGTQSAMREVKLAVVRSWKGLDKHEQITLRTSAQSALCGYAFAKGVSYLIYAQQDAGQLSVSACSRTRRMADAGEDLIALGAGATPVTIAAKSAGDAGVSDAGALDAGGAVKPVKRGGGCASTRGQASLAPYLLGLPALMWRRRRRA